MNIIPFKKRKDSYLRMSDRQIRSQLKRFSLSQSAEG